MKRLQKLISLMLALAMLMSCLPLSAFAEDDVVIPDQTISEEEIVIDGEDDLTAEEPEDEPAEEPAGDPAADVQPEAEEPADDDENVILSEEEPEEESVALSEEDSLTITAASYYTGAYGSSVTMDLTVTATGSISAPTSYTWYE